MKLIFSLLLLMTVSACAGLEGTGNSKTVYFDFGSNSLTNDARATIDAVAEEILSGKASHGAPWKHDNCHTKLGKSCQGDVSRVSLVGHTDTVGPVAANQALSERRINAVKQRLIQQGVAADVISGTAESENNNAVSTGDNVKEAANRRVVIYVY
jgi:outer membrane protein OmpA-like peptidoglycan-associated protein